jgi:hypothetical protein
MNKHGLPVIKLIKMLLPVTLLMPVVFYALLPIPIHAAGTTVICIPTSGTATSQTLIMGKGFSGKVATIHWDDVVMAENVPISEEGGFTYTLTIPSDFRGEHTIYIEDDSHWSGSTGSVPFTVTPSLSLYPRWGDDYTPVTIKGEGFGPHEDNIKIIMDGETLPQAGFISDAFGTWTTTISVHSDVKGKHFFKAFGDETTAEEMDEISFVLTPWLEIEPREGPAGTDIKISAWGFVTSEVGITITWDNEAIERGLTARSDGSLEYELKTPESTTGPHIVRISLRGVSNNGSFPEQTFTTTPSLSIDPIAGNKGTEVKVTATGLKENDPVTVYYNGENTGLTASTDKNGSMRTAFTIPQSDKKVNIIKVSDTRGFSQQAEFTIENLPPSEPSALTPVSGEQIAIFNSTLDMLFKGYRLLFDKTYGINMIDFSWSVPSASEPLSYIVQIARDNSFTSLVLNKEIEGDTSYMAMDSNPFTSGHYWWRVKAVDSFGNESAWSDTAELDIITAPLRVIIISSVVVLLFISAIIVGIMVARALTVR